MRIKVLQTMAGANGLYEAGQEYEVDDELGYSSLCWGMAERLDPVEEVYCEPFEVERSYVKETPKAPAAKKFIKKSGKSAENL